MVFLLLASIIIVVVDDCYYVPKLGCHGSSYVVLATHPGTLWSQRLIYFLNSELFKK